MHDQIKPFGLLDNPLLYWNFEFQSISTSKDVNLPSKIFCTKICFEIHLYNNTSPILRNQIQIQLMDYVFYLL
jgi:hypothetical protein